MHGVGAFACNVQCKLMPAACVSVLLAAHVSLGSRLSSSTADLCLRREKKKSGKKYDGGGGGEEGR